MKSIFLYCLLFFFQITWSQSHELKIADSLAAVGKHAEAIDVLETSGDDSEKAILRIAQFQEATGKRAEAMENYKKLLQQNPERVIVAVRYGELLLDTKNYEKADSIFNSLIEKHPDNASFNYRLGLAREKLKDSTAIELFFRTVELDSTHQAALYKTAKHFLRTGKSHNAISQCQKGLITRPDNTSLLSILGQAYSATFQFEKAIDPFARLVELGDSSEFILEKLASAYRRSDKTDEAINTYKRLIELDNMNGAAHSNIGVLYLKKDEIGKAKEHFMMALFIKNRPADLEFVNLGLAYKRKEDFKSAFKSFENALAENPENPRAMIELAIAADAYFADKESVLKLYQNFIDRHKDAGYRRMLDIAEYRISELKKEIHLAE